MEHGGAFLCQQRAEDSVGRTAQSVATLAELLDPDDAELAARDLEDLTREAISPKPRATWWQRAARGLIDTAKKTAEVGIPVIDLVTRITALIGS